MSEIKYAILQNDFIPASMAGLKKLLDGLPSHQDLLDYGKELEDEIEAATAHNAHLSLLERKVGEKVTTLEAQFKDQCIRFVNEEDNNAVEVHDELGDMLTMQHVCDVGSIRRDIDPIKEKTEMNTSDIKYRQALENYVSEVFELVEYVVENEIDGSRNIQVPSDFGSGVLNWGSQSGRGDESKMTVRLCKLLMHKNHNKWIGENCIKYWKQRPLEIFR